MNRTLLFIIACYLTACSFQALSEEESNLKNLQEGTLKGTGHYQADSKRPWRYGRYYIRHSGKGFLAEAVVSLSRKKNESSGVRREPVTKLVDQQNFQFIPETTAILSAMATRD